MVVSFDRIYCACMLFMLFCRPHCALTLCTKTIATGLTKTMSVLVHDVQFIGTVPGIEVFPKKNISCVC